MRTLQRLTAGLIATVVVVGAWLVPTTAEAAAKPVATSISATTLDTAGGVKLTITGKNLKKVNAVYFGSTKTTKLSHPSKTRLIVTAPGHVPGTVAIKLRVGTMKYTTKLSVTYTATPTEASAFEAEVLRLTNEWRAAGYTCTDPDAGLSTVMPPVPALSWNGMLGSSARKHSADMAAKNYFSHTSKDGTAFSTRITRSGYSWSNVGENIAAGYSTPESVVKGWLDSYGHCENMMDATFTELGVGYAYSEAATYRHYWTQDFGRPLS